MHKTKEPKQVTLLLDVPQRFKRFFSLPGYYTFWELPSDKSNLDIEYVVRMPRKILHKQGHQIWVIRTRLLVFINLA